MIKLKRDPHIYDMRPTDGGGQYCCGTKRPGTVWTAGRKIHVITCPSCHAVFSVTRIGPFGLSGNEPLPLEATP